MASREIVTGGPNELDPAAAQWVAERRAAREDELWNGWSVVATQHHGVEVTCRTSSASYGIFGIYAALAAVGILITCAAVPGLEPGNPYYSPAPAIFGISLLIVFVLAIVCALTIPLMSSEWMRTFQLESLEIRPDGIDINQGRFFHRREIFNIDVDRKRKSAPSDGEYGWACQGIIGTREMVLLDGLDYPTAMLLKDTLDRAKRMLWADSF